MRRFYKHLVILAIALVGILPLTACSTNPATGASQLSFMSPAQEAQMGAKEHAKVMEMFGEVPDKALRDYVTRIGQSLAVHTERPEVTYKFFVLDTPMVNAFALPGGYVYITRGILTLANNEAELAAVMAHEIGHITARHSAERYSQGVLAAVGTLAVSLATDSGSVARAANLGSELFLKSYSRGQEHESDGLGIRYLSKAGYDTFAMASFLSNMDAEFALESRIEGKKQEQISYFSTHPRTEDRVAQASSIASTYPKGSAVQNREAYLSAIDGMVYGDGMKQGFMRGRDFYHPEMGFTFRVPEGFRIVNQPEQIAAVSANGTVILFDAASRGGLDAYSYMTGKWMAEQPLRNAEAITVNGMRAATGEFDGRVDGKIVTIRLLVVEWSPNRFFRFQIAIPPGLSSAALDDVKRTTYSLRALSAQEKNTIRPYAIRLVTAKTGDTPASLSRSMPVDGHHEDRFRAMNGMSRTSTLLAGRRYKVVSER